MIKQALIVLLLIGLGTIFFSLNLTFEADESLNKTGHYYAVASAGDTGAANIVTSIIVTYRGLDTLGEVTVLFLTAAIVGLVLSRSCPVNRRQPRPDAGELLLTGKDLLVPLILLLGVYVFINGHLTPGGGFQGGAILASALLLLLLSEPMRHFSHRLITRVESTSGLLFVSIGVAGMVIGGGFLDNRILPLGEFGQLFSAGAIPIIYSLIGLKVGAEFSSMLIHFAETGDPEQ
ncbi:sodium:proton antiporter [Ectothiorhodospiraceae bacterium BW-2]|nr:sodium:proton antiporter [Ectothiorhodospiraceae bacterium BW-2]